VWPLQQADEEVALVDDVHAGEQRGNVARRVRGRVPRTSAQEARCPCPRRPSRYGGSRSSRLPPRRGEGAAAGNSSSAGVRPPAAGEPSWGAARARGGSAGRAIRYSPRRGATRISKTPSGVTPSPPRVPASGPARAEHGGGVAFGLAPEEDEVRAGTSVSPSAPIREDPRVGGVDVVASQLDRPPLAGGHRPVDHAHRLLDRRLAEAAGSEGSTTKVSFGPAGPRSRARERVPRRAESAAWAARRDLPPRTSPNAAREDAARCRALMAASARDPRRSPEECSPGPEAETIRGVTTLTRLRRLDLERPVGQAAAAAPAFTDTLALPKYVRMDELLQALGAPRRREILALVRGRERSAGEIHRALGDVTFGRCRSTSASWSGGAGAGPARGAPPLYEPGRRASSPCGGGSSRCGTRASRPQGARPEAEERAGNGPFRGKAPATPRARPRGEKR